MRKYSIIVPILIFMFFNIMTDTALGMENYSIGSMILLEPEGEYIKDDGENLYKEDSDVVQVFSTGNNSIPLTKNDIYLMAQIVHAESKGEPYTGKVAVASVILNRVTDPAFPKSIEGVIKQKNAFSCVVNGNITATPNSDSEKAVMDALSGSDPTNRAVFFYNPEIATSSWMKDIGKTNVTTIGNHVFFQVKK